MWGPRRPGPCLVIVIDGPAGSGKTTTAKLVAERLHCIFLDTGAMYRAFTLKALRAGIDCRDGPALAELTRSTNIRLQPRPEGLRVKLDGEDVTEEIRSRAVDAAVSHVAMIADVRRWMVRAQREATLGRSVVAEGRDMGTVVFPDADVKVFLSASLEERARRRREDARARGESPSLEDVRTELQRRDTLDSQRSLAPLRQAPDAVWVDTTHLTVDEQVERVLELVGET